MNYAIPAEACFTDHIGTKRAAYGTVDIPVWAFFVNGVPIIALFGMFPMAVPAFGLSLDGQDFAVFTADDALRDERVTVFGGRVAIVTFFAAFDDAVAAVS